MCGLSWCLMIKLSQSIFQPFTICLCPLYARCGLHRERPSFGWCDKPSWQTITNKRVQMNRMKNRKRFQSDQCPTNFILQSETNSDFQAIRGTYFSSYLSVTVCQCQGQLWQKTFPLWNVIYSSTRNQNWLFDAFNTHNPSALQWSIWCRWLWLREQILGLEQRQLWS